MPTLEQIRAARALLGWSQSDLAERAGLSQTGIARIENGTNHPNSQTLTKIEVAFEENDIEFIDTSGVRKKTGDVHIYKGQTGIRQFFDDVYEQADTEGGEICLFNGMPAYLIKWLGDDWYNYHAKRMRKIKNKFEFKIIVREKEKTFIASDFATYKWFPEHQFNEKTIYVYGNKIGFLSFDNNNVRIVVIAQKEIADSFRVLFNLAWENVAQDPKS
ncbi:MAG: hypothetical protein CMH27_01275 [Micavibrio sp.]|nr:hypothetical protein [Micavibrio sp.]|tara:strand:- start:2862 stop:3512 length:651 start_codon:yes stop_codon:yes gene_type:complete